MNDILTILFCILSLITIIAGAYIIAVIYTAIKQLLIEFLKFIKQNKWKQLIKMLR